MAHFAKVNDNNIVETVVVVSNDHEANGETYLNGLGLSGRWVQTSYNNNFRGRFAGVGFIYLEDQDVFAPPKPDNENEYVWNESSAAWEVVTTP